MPLLESESERPTADAAAALRQALDDAGLVVPLDLDSVSAASQAAASGAAVSGGRAGQSVLRLVAGNGEEARDKTKSTEPTAEALGVNLYAQ